MDMMNAHGTTYDSHNNTHPGPTMGGSAVTSSTAAAMTNRHAHHADDVHQFSEAASSAVRGSGYYFGAAPTAGGAEYDRAQLPPATATTSTYATTAHDYARSANHAGLNPPSSSHQHPRHPNIAASSLATTAAARLLAEHRSRTAALLRQQEAAAYHYGPVGRYGVGGTGESASAGALGGYPPAGRAAMAATPEARRTEAEIAHLQAALDAKRAERRLLAAAAAHAAALGSPRPRPNAALEYGAGRGGAVMNAAAAARHCDLNPQPVVAQHARVEKHDDRNSQHGGLAVLSEVVRCKSMPSAGVKSSPWSNDDGAADVLAAAQACLNLAGRSSPQCAAKSLQKSSSMPNKHPSLSTTSVLLPPKAKFSPGMGETSSMVLQARAQPLKKAEEVTSSSKKTKKASTKVCDFLPTKAESSNVPRSSCGLPLKKRKAMPSTSDKESKEQQPKQPKKKGRKKENGMPRRPLSAYNIFFSEERERILNEIPCPEGDEGEGKGGKSENGSSPTVTPPPAAAAASSGTHDDLAAAHRVLMERRNSDSAGCKKRRRHRRTHGKISFRDLAKTIGQRWKALPHQDMDRYRKLAEIDMKRYQADMERYHAVLRGETEIPFGSAASGSLPAAAS